MKLTVYTDGASRGNPGKSGAGALIFDERKQKATSLNKYLGISTNNEAEYKALIIALEYLAVMQDGAKIREIIFFSDSQLLVNQMSGIYSVKSANILPLYLKAKKILKDLDVSSKFMHISRSLNKEADKLANLAIDSSK